MTLESLTEKIHKKSDEQLQKEIEAASDQMHRFLSDGTAWELEIGGKKLHWYTVLELLRKRAFELNQERRRNEAVKNFLAEVEQFKRQLDTLVDE